MFRKCSHAAVDSPAVGKTAISYATTVSALFRRLKQWQSIVNDTLVLDPVAFGIHV